MNNVNFSDLKLIERRKKSGIEMYSHPSVLGLIEITRSPTGKIFVTRLDCYGKCNHDIRVDFKK